MADLPEENGTLDDVAQNDINMPGKGKDNKSGIAKDTTKKVAKEAGKKLGNTKFGEVFKAGYEAVKTVAKEVSSKLLSMLSEILVPVIIIVCAIGLISFFLNMPGVMREKMNKFFSEALGGFSEFLYGTTKDLDSSAIDVNKRIELLNYIEDMGIDVVGFGFVPMVYRDDNNEIIGYNPTPYVSGSITNWTDIAWNDLTDVQPATDLLYYYLMMNERSYVLADRGLFGSDKGPTGMINTSDSFADGIEVTIDRENKLLKVSKNQNLFTESNFAYSLEGWTGRYGIPLEFSLALHIASMSSGMVEELLQHEDLQTQVNIDLDEAECSIDFIFRFNNGKEINVPFLDKNGDANVILNTVQNGGKITKDMISIQALQSAYTAWSFTDYQVINNAYENDGTGKKFISAYLDTMSAMLSSNDIAVQTSGSSYGTKNSNVPVPVFMRKDTDTSTIDYGDVCENVTINSGAYICQYNSDGTPNINTGKLRRRAMVDADNTRLLWGEVVNNTPAGFIKYVNVTGQENTTTGDGYIYMQQTIDVDGNIVSNIGDNSLHCYEVIPSGNSSNYIAEFNYGGNIITSQRMSGLGKAINSGNKLQGLMEILQKQDAYRAMFKEIDWFLAVTSYYNGWQNGMGLNYLNTADGGISTGAIYNFCNSGYNCNPSDISYYGAMYDQILKMMYDNQMSDAMDLLYNETYGLYAKMQQDYNFIISISPSVNTAESQIQSALAEIGCTGLTAPIVDYMYATVTQNPETADGTTKYAQPYITSVIKHWYKDIDFSDAYEETNTPIEFEFTGETELLKDINVITKLTPISKGLKTQTEQPYVVKGNIVLCDGEKIGNTQNVTLGETGDSDYNWGDGYRATKKIFTKGLYYTYDGSHETGLSIYLQRQIENTNGMCKFTVESGRVTSWYDYASNSNGSIKVGTEEDYYEIDNTEAEYNVANGSTIFGAGNVYDKNGISVYNTYTHIRKETGSEIKEYVMYVDNNSMKYISPVSDDNVDYEGVVLPRVETINEVWDSVGVSCKRVPVSFDNVTKNGQVVSITGLTILKNSKTEDAEYIYRDLKEMLIELGYYTEAEFEYLDTNILKWLIPEYPTSTWPQNSDGDELDFAAILYPYEEMPDEGEDTDGSNENTNIDVENLTNEQIRDALGITRDKEQGFTEGLRVIAPGDCIVISKDNNKIEIEFNGETQPEIAILDGYNMIIEGIVLEGITTESGDTIGYQDAINNKTIIKAGDTIGVTGTEKIRIVLKDDKGRILSNVQDYMVDPSKLYTGEFSEEFYYYLGVYFEGMKSVEGESRFTNANKNVNRIETEDYSEPYVTVGPGIYMDATNSAEYTRLTGENFDNTSLNSTFLKWPIIEMFYAIVDEKKVVIENYMEGYNLSQNQMEALILSAYQRGTGSGSTLWNVLDAIKNGVRGEELKQIWTPHELEGVRKRREAEWYLFTYGTYIDKDSLKEIQFQSDTPFSDMLGE